MNSLLRKQRIIISISVLVEILAVIAAIVFYIFFPDFRYYFYFAVGGAALFSMYNAALIFGFNIRFKTEKGKSEMKAAEILGTDIYETYDFGKVGIVVCDFANTVLWASENLNQKYPNLVDDCIFKTFDSLTKLVDPNIKKEDKEPVIAKDANQNSYSVEYIEDSHVFIFRDVTDYEQLKERNENEAPVIGYIAIDNYSDIQISISDENKFVDMYSDARKDIAEFAAKYNAMLRRIKDDRYLFITNHENYVKMLRDKFYLLDQVKTIKDSTGTLYFTASIGVAYGFPQFSRLADDALGALDVALSRGGDQAVVQGFKEEIRYFGGKSELQPARNRVKIRQGSSSLARIVQAYNNIIIMGHTIADFDAIGSALGAYLFCKHFTNAPVKICWDGQLVDNKCRQMVESYFPDREEMGEIFVSMRNVEPMIKERTLLIAVDHNNPRQSMFPEINGRFKHVVVIDHHRPGDYLFSNIEFDGIDSSASSASELLTFYISFNTDEIHLDSRTATFLLTGICLDTHFFKNHTSDSTFEASAYLKNNGADLSAAVEAFKEGAEEHALKISILNRHFSPVSDVMVCLGEEDETISSEMISMVADEALTIKDINLSFCIAHDTVNSVKISCRSNGTVNCEILGRKLGGGGHLTMAASTLRNTTIDDVRRKLEDVLDDYLDECRIQVYKED